MQALTKAIQSSESETDPDDKAQTQSLVERQAEVRLRHEQLLSLGSLLDGSELMLKEEMQRCIDSLTSPHPSHNTISQYQYVSPL